MKVTVDGKTYEFHEDRLTNVEGMAVEKVTGWTFGEWIEGLNKKNAEGHPVPSMLALTALIWVIQKRDEPSLRFSQVEFAVASLEFELDEDDAEDDEGKDEEDAASSSPMNSTGT